MNYDTFLYTRGYEKNEDYHWVTCADYVSKKDFYPIISDMFELRYSISSFLIDESKYVGIFDIFDEFCVFYRIYISKHNDYVGRDIFSIEGVTCRKKDIKFLYLDIPNIVSEWGESNTTIQDLYYNKRLCSSVEMSNTTNVIDYLFDSNNEEKKSNQLYISFINYLKNNDNRTPMIIGENADILARELKGNKDYQVVDTRKITSLNEVGIPKFRNRLNSMKPTIRIKGNIDKKGLYSYRWEADNIDDNIMDDNRTIIFKSNNSTPSSIISVNKMIKEKTILDKVLSAQGYGI